jgi:4-hydroxy-tetrahydrodipicolinate synthase
MNNQFTGTGVALVTPFNDNDSVDFVALEKLVKYQINNGTDFLVVQGTTGESPTLSWEEKIDILEAVLDIAGGAVPVVFGVGGNNTKAISESFKKIPAGVSGILSVSPYYNKPTQKGIIAHYTYIAEHTNLPIILYNVPGRTGSNMTAATTLELAKISNIVAVKEASGNMGQIMEILRQRPDGFGVLSGDDALTLPMIACGADGVISVVANAFPERFNEMVHSGLKGDLKKSREAHFDLLPITDMFFEEGNPGGVKASLETQGIMKQKMRMPLYPVSDDLYTRIKQETKRIIG